ncbi:single-stranded DNA-binding protein [Campylobacter concisus]|uniref:single-stranded DNA-binding protein n=1 Tax=Campylobacter concisus TaxID=199 RepID=UPI00122C6190|nr:single-stranded DNA-binding protein [Campylobacter concisus]
MFNKVVLVGNLTRDIELRYTTSGSAIGNSGIAVTRRFNTNGEKREETCFIDISFFGKAAEIANQYLSKGSKLLVEGRLKFDQWTDNNGQNRSKHSIVVENMEMLGGNGGAGGQNQGGFNQNNSYSQQRNYGSNNSYGDSGYQNSTPQRQQAQQQSKKQQEYYEEKIPDINVDADDFEGDNEIPF